MGRFGREAVHVDQAPHPSTHEWRGEARGRHWLFMPERRGATDRRKVGYRGSVLVLLLWILMIVSYLAGEYVAHTRQKGMVALDAVERFHRESAIQSVLTLVATGRYDTLLKQVNAENDTAWDPEDLIEGLMALLPPEALDDRNAVSHAAEMKKELDSWMGLVIHGTRCYVKMASESTKTILSLKNENTIRTQLADIYGEDRKEAADAFTDAILDWLDPDDLVRLSGAESPYYLDEYPAHHAANGPFQSMTQLFCLKGFDERLFWGAQTVKRGVAEDDETGLDEDGTLFASILRSKFSGLFSESGDPSESEGEMAVPSRSPEASEGQGGGTAEKGPQGKGDGKTGGDPQAKAGGWGERSLLDRFTVYPSGDKRITFYFPEEERVDQEILWLSNTQGRWRVVERLSRTLIVE